MAAEFRARQVRNFPRAGRTELDDVLYHEYDRNGLPVTGGNADRAVYFTEREDAEVAGAIRLRSQSQGVWLEAETLRWEDASHRLFSGPDETVALTRDDGSQVTGVGLQVDVCRKTSGSRAPSAEPWSAKPGRGSRRKARGGGAGGGVRPLRRSVMRGRRLQPNRAPWDRRRGARAGRCSHDLAGPSCNSA